MLAGGSGTRLWPLSRSAVPKHLLPLGPGGKSLLHATVERLVPLEASIHVVTVAAQAAECANILRMAAGSGRGEVIAEPVARGTGPALGLAVKWIARSDPEAVICSVHADHYVGDDRGYRTALWAAAGWVSHRDGLATVGITPTYPATGLGYVELDGQCDGSQWVAPREASHVNREHVDDPSALPAYTAARFVEKPPLEEATRYVTDGNHLWNTGLFAWTADAFLHELRTAAPDLDTTLDEIVLARAEGNDQRGAEQYAALKSVAIDPLIMERTTNLTVVAASFPWSDLGSWADLYAARRRYNGDNTGNVVEGDCVLLNSENCLVSARGGRVVAVVGAHDLVVVDTGDAVLVVPTSEVQGVREVVDTLTAQERTDLL